MSKQQNHVSRRFTTGITLDSSVQLYLDDLASRMRSSRSWVLNTIVYEYARLMEKRDLLPLSTVMTGRGTEEPVIR